jgi:hypothetical protein
MNSKLLFSLDFEYSEDSRASGEGSQRVSSLLLRELYVNLVALMAG